MPNCPQCGLDVADLLPIDPELKMRVKEIDSDYQLVDQICRSCLLSLRKKASASGSLLVAQEKAKHDRKGKLWKSRTSLIKQGHAQMSNKLYSEAAISYEKYLKLMEIVFEVETGKLTPQLFKEAAKTPELTVVAGIYWDLVKIYDTSDQYGDRQRMAINQLVKFLPFTPIYPDVVRKASAFAKQARHPDVIRGFLATIKQQGLRCFIATSTFDSGFAPEVIELRNFRDHVLLKKKWGHTLVEFYYFSSPPIARLINKFPVVKPALRATLRAVIKCVNSF